MVDASPCGDWGLTGVLVCMCAVALQWGFLTRHKQPKPLGVTFLPFPICYREGLWLNGSYVMHAKGPSSNPWDLLVEMESTPIWNPRESLPVSAELNGPMVWLGIRQLLIFSSIWESLFLFPSWSDLVLLETYGRRSRRTLWSHIISRDNLWLDDLHLATGNPFRSFLATRRDLLSRDIIKRLANLTDRWLLVKRYLTADYNEILHFQDLSMIGRSNIVLLGS